MEQETAVFLCIPDKLLARHPNTFGEQTFKIMIVPTEGGDEKTTTFSSPEECGYGSYN